MDPLYEAVKDKNYSLVEEYARKGTFVSDNVISTLIDDGNASLLKHMYQYGGFSLDRLLFRAVDLDDIGLVSWIFQEEKRTGNRVGRYPNLVWLVARYGTLEMFQLLVSHGFPVDSASFIWSIGRIDGPDYDLANYILNLQNFQVCSLEANRAINFLRSNDLPIPDQLWDAIEEPEVEH